jgi:hypothetical protein
MKEELKPEIEKFMSPAKEGKCTILSVLKVEDMNKQLIWPIAIISAEFNSPTAFMSSCIHVG